MSRETRTQPQLVVTTSNLPSSVMYVAPTEGAQVSGVTPPRVRAQAGTEWIGVYASGCPGNQVGHDTVQDANGEWSFQWDTTVCENGVQNLDTWAFRNDGSNLGHATISVTLDDEPQPPPPDRVACEPSAEPQPVAGQGYLLRFSDCFGTLSRTVWCSNQWWEPNPPLGTQYVSDGVLHLVGRRSDGYPNLSVSPEPCGQTNPQSFRRGYFEARLHWTDVPVQALPSGSSRPPTRPIRGGRSRPARSQPACRPRSTCSRGTGTTSTSSPARSAAIRSAATANRIG